MLLQRGGDEPEKPPQLAQVLWGRKIISPMALSGNCHYSVEMLSDFWITMYHKRVDFSWLSWGCHFISRFVAVSEVHLCICVYTESCGDMMVHT